MFAILAVPPQGHAVRLRRTCLRVSAWDECQA